MRGNFSFFAKLILDEEGLAKGQLRSVFCDKRHSFRKCTRRLFFKKNGAPRPEFVTWVRMEEKLGQRLRVPGRQGIFRIFPDFQSPARLNLALCDRHWKCTSELESTLRSGLDTAKHKSCAMRIFICGSDAGARKELRTFMQNFASCDVEKTIIFYDPLFSYDLSIGSNDIFLDPQNSCWQLLLGARHLGSVSCC